MTDGWLTPGEQQVWRDFLRVHRDLMAAVGRQLIRDSGLSGPEYAVLVSLSEAPGERLRPVGLMESLDWEQSRVSHQVTRMERRGLIAREECASDGRGAFVVLTEAGRAAITSAAPGHVATVRQLVFDRLAPDDIKQLGASYTQILQAIDESQLGPDASTGTGTGCGETCR